MKNRGLHLTKSGIYSIKIMTLLRNMKLILKNYFIPHPGNEHRPHILRIKAILYILVASLFVELLFLAHITVIKQTGLLAEIISSVLVEQTNVNRTTLGINELRVNPILEAAAKLKATDMATRSYFAHTSPEGLTPWSWLEAVGYSFLTAGENLAVNFVDSEDVTNAWMASPSHKANIVNGNFTEIGVATAKGTYKGKDAIFVVQFFGKPVVSSVLAETEAPTTIEPEVIKVEEDTFIEFEEVAGVAEEIEEPTNEVVVAQQHTSAIERAVANPKTSYNLLLIIMGTVIALALVLKIFIRIDIQHPPLIVNGVLVLIVVASALVFNNYLALTGTAVI